MVGLRREYEKALGILACTLWEVVGLVCQLPFRVSVTGGTTGLPVGMIGHAAGRLLCCVGHTHSTLTIDDQLPGCPLFAAKCKTAVAYGGSAVRSVLDVLAKAAPADRVSLMRIVALVDTVVVRRENEPIFRPLPVTSLAIAGAA